MHWEYKTIKLLNHQEESLLDKPNFDEKLNEMSNNGWELVTYTSVVKYRLWFRITDDSGYIVATFRRPQN